MLINFVLVALIFGAGKTKLSPYLAAFSFGAVKGLIYFLGSRSMIVAAVAFLVFAGLATALMLLFERINRRELSENAISDYTLRRKSSFKWEYLPLSVVVILLIFGEALLV